MAHLKQQMFKYKITFYLLWLNLLYVCIFISDSNRVKLTNIYRDIHLSAYLSTTFDLCSALI